ncbi:MAG: hypothetical protein IIV43_06520, partial [Oscillospiraceae bacterium]|nr:hypothetical protein [Oscillospiraceae bacterium]
FGAGDEEIEYPEVLRRIGHEVAVDEEEFFCDDVEYGDFEGETICSGKTESSDACKTRWGEGSK